MTTFQRGAAFGLGGLILAIIYSSNPAFAISREQAIQNCRATVGQRIVQACMQRVGGGPANLGGCRATASPSVRRCVMQAMGHAPPVGDRVPPRKGATGKASSRPALENVARRGVISDIAPLPADESRVAIGLAEIEGMTISTKSLHENSIQPPGGGVIASRVSQTFNIKIISKETIEVQRESQVLDENDKPRGPALGGSRMFKLGKEEAVQGGEAVWRFEDSALFSIASLSEGGYRIVLPIFMQDNLLKCIALSGYAREDGRGAVRIVGAKGVLVEVLSSRKISSSCEVKR